MVCHTTPSLCFKKVVLLKKERDKDHLYNNEMLYLCFCVNDGHGHLHLRNCMNYDGKGDQAIRKGN